jgi:hypothetical protein
VSASCIWDWYEPAAAGSQGAGLLPINMLTIPCGGHSGKWALWITPRPNADTAAVSLLQPLELPLSVVAGKLARRGMRVQCSSKAAALSGPVEALHRPGSQAAAQRQQASAELTVLEYNVTVKEGACLELALELCDEHGNVVAEDCCVGLSGTLEVAQGSLAAKGGVVKLPRLQVGCWATRAVLACAEVHTYASFVTCGCCCGRAGLLA